MKRLIIPILCISFQLVFPLFVSAQTEEEKKQLQMFFKEEDLQVVSATRSLKPISRVAENMTVITAEEIERMNAHTLDEVLNTVTGIQLAGPRTPGNSSVVNVQGADSQFVTVLMDGVVINSIGNNFANIGILPVQQIERIEIIKGPASSAWGSALGGVINIITKGPPDKGAAGMASASYGSKNTADFRAEAGGRAGNAGIYISAGTFFTDGFRFSQGVSNKSVYSKLTYDVMSGTELKATVFYLNSHKWLGDFSAIDEADRNREEQYFGTISLTSRLSNDIVLDVGGSAKRASLFASWDTLSTGANITKFYNDDTMYNAYAKIEWKVGGQKIVAGAEYNYWIGKYDVLINGKQHLEKAAVFINDTITLGDLAVTPGFRYEYASISNNPISPSLGATYQLTKRTVLRTSVAEGFYVPTLTDKYYAPAPNPDLKVTRAWSYQAGFETAELKYVWLKAMAFSHHIKDMIEYDSNQNFMSVNTGRQKRQGIELEAKTFSYYNTWLSGGFTFTDARNSGNDIIKDVPRYTYDVALNYDDKKSFKAVLRGRYVWWNSNDYQNGKYSSFIFDISAAKRIYTYDRHSFEIFALAHNIFNDNQYYLDFYRNPRRWAEAGIRYKF